MRQIKKMGACLTHFSLQIWFCCLLFAACSAQADPAQVLVLGTPRPEANYGGELLRRIHQEAFKRLGVPIEMRTLPTARLTLELESGRIDGDLGRPGNFGERQPNLVRVEEPVTQVAFALWTLNPQHRLQRLDQLAGSGLSVGLTRGVVECEEGLQNLLPAHSVVQTATTVHALNLMHAGRIDLYCGIDLAILSDAGSPEYAGRATPIRLFNIGEPFPLYLYLQKKHAALAGKLSLIIKKMKAEGTLDQIRKDTLHEFGLTTTP